MVSAAVARGLDARVADAQEIVLGETFDCAFSNAALHWMPRQDAVLEGIRRHVVPGGRFVGELGGRGCCAAIVTALRSALRDQVPDVDTRSPWTFPSPDAFRARLERCGFTVDEIVWFPRPTPLPTGLRGWIGTFADPWLHGIDGRAREAVLADVERLLAPSLQHDDGTWFADYVRLRFVARRR
jgi:trans-aconitate methyltransferase